MAWRVVVTADAFRRDAPGAEEPLRRAGCEVSYPDRMGPLPAEELVAALAGADAVIASSDPYNERTLVACPRLRVLVRWGTGVDTVDLDACTAAGVLACNAPGLNVEAVADHTLGVMLALARRLTYQTAVMRAGGWEEVRGVDLWRKTVGIVGFGAVGRAVARRLAGFQCRVMAFDPLLPPGAVEATGAEPAELEALFSTADFVSLHASLTPETRGLVSAVMLGRMKPSAFLVNTARGPLVDEAALVCALREGRIAGAAIDAFESEPLPADHPLRAMPNCLATPHSAFNTQETADAVNAAVAEQVVDALQGRRPRFLLNPAVLASPRPRG